MILQYTLCIPQASDSYHIDRYTMVNFGILAPPDGIVLGLCWNEVGKLLGTETLAKHGCLVAKLVFAKISIEQYFQTVNA